MSFNNPEIGNDYRAKKKFNDPQKTSVNKKQHNANRENINTLQKGILQFRETEIRQYRQRENKEKRYNPKREKLRKQINPVLSVEGYYLFMLHLPIEISVSVAHSNKGVNITVVTVNTAINAT